MRDRSSERGFQAPDGGWGYMILIAVAINLVILETHNLHHAILYKDLYVQLNMNASEISSLDGLTAVIFSISGFLTSSLLKLISIRKLALIAATALSLGEVSMKFIRSTAILFITQGIIQAFAAGVLFVLCFTVIIQYFDKKRLLAVAAIQSVTTAIATFVSPKLIKWALDRFGGLGAVFFLSAFTMNTVLAAVLMQPVSWHRRKMEIPETKQIELTVLMKENRDETNQINDSNKFKLNKDLSKNFIDKFLGDYTDIMIRKKFLLSIAPLGLSLAGFADGTFVTMLPRALRSMGWNASQTTWAVSLQTYGDLFTKILFVATCKWTNMLSRREMYVGGLIIALLTRIGMLWTDNATVMLVFLTIMGIPRCCIVLLAPLVVAESVGTERFSAALGIVVLMSGLFNLVLSSVIDAVLGLTHSYPTVFYILASFYGIIIMFWSIELLYKKNKHKWIMKKDNLSTK